MAGSHRPVEGGRPAGARALASAPGAPPRPGGGVDPGGSARAADPAGVHEPAPAGALMYPARFHYEAPSTVDEVLQLLAMYQGEAKVMSGGMSLIPLMKLRFASPSCVIDVNNIAG